MAAPPAPTMKILGVPREILARERRVALTPPLCKKLIGKGFGVIVEQGAGETAGFLDAEYTQVGCTVVDDVTAVYQRADVIMKINPPLERHPRLRVEESDLFRENQVLVSYIYPNKNAALLEKLRAKRVTVFAMDRLPRTTLAQNMDTLSSQAKVTGRRAMLEAAIHFNRFLSAEMTCAGNNPPAKVFIIGCGVAGLEAIGAAKKLGCQVFAFDVRSAARHDAESMGAKFVEPDFKEDGSGTGGYARESSDRARAAQEAMVMKMAEDVDIIITTANLPGRKSPVLVKEEAVMRMKKGSVIVDLAAANGGNCTLTIPGEVRVVNGVTIIGAVDFESRVAYQSSMMWATNMHNLLEECIDSRTKQWRVTRDGIETSEILRGLTQCMNAEMLPAPPPPAVGPAPTPAAAEPPKAGKKAEKKEDEMPAVAVWVIIITTVIVLALLSLGAPASLLGHLLVFILGAYLGWCLISNVPSSLNTPLMSVTNAISGIVYLGAVGQVGYAGRWFNGEGSLAVVTVLGACAMLVSSVNVVGGYAVTQKTLAMFKKSK